MNIRRLRVFFSIALSWLCAEPGRAQLTWLPTCPNQGVQHVAASRSFGPPSGGMGPLAWVPAWILWTPAHRQPIRRPGHYLRAIRTLPVEMAFVAGDPHLLVRGPHARRIISTVTDAMPALCTLPIRR